MKLMGRVHLRRMERACIKLIKWYENKGGEHNVCPLCRIEKNRIYSCCYCPWWIFENIGCLKFVAKNYKESHCGIATKVFGEDKDWDKLRIKMLNQWLKKIRKLQTH